MPKELSSYNFDAYDWDLLLDGRLWRCELGIDFGRKGVDVRCGAQNFAAKARSAARQRDLLLDNRVEQDGVVILRARLKPSQRPRLAQ